MLARWLPVHGVNAGRGDLNVLAISDQRTKQPFRDGAAADVSCTNEEDVFHKMTRAREH
jgi:hypothetical protein